MPPPLSFLFHLFLLVVFCFSLVPATSSVLVELLPCQHLLLCETHMFSRLLYSPSHFSLPPFFARHPFLSALSSDDGSVRVWDAAKTECIKAAELQTPLRCVAYSPDGKYLAVGQQDGALVVLDATTLQEVSQPQSSRRRPRRCTVPLPCCATQPISPHT